jgi:RNA polymerase sigma factor (sigma-70 family)
MAIKLTVNSQTMNSQEVRDKLILKYSWVVYSVWKRLRNIPAVGRLAEDGIQEGFLGLIDAAERWNPLSGMKFKTFAYGVVKEKIVLAARAECKKTIQIKHNELALLNTIDKHNFLDQLMTREQLDHLLKYGPKNLVSPGTRPRPDSQGTGHECRSVATRIPAFSRN